MEKSFDLNTNEVLEDAILRLDNNLLLQAIQNGASVNEIDEDGMTPLTEAYIQKNFGAIRILLENGANPNKTNRFRENPLEIAINQINDGLDLGALDILLENGADPNVIGRKGQTALRNAIECNSDKIHHMISKLLKFRACPNTQDLMGQTCLHMAIEELYLWIWIRNSDHEIIRSLIRSIQLLLENGADPTIQNKLGSAVTDLKGWKRYLEEVEKIVNWDKRKPLLRVRNQLHTKFFR